MNFKTNDIVKRNDNGRLVIIESVKTVGDLVFYVTHDKLDGHTTILAHNQLEEVRETRR